MVLVRSLSAEKTQRILPADSPLKWEKHTLHVEYRYGQGKG